MTEKKLPYPYSFTERRPLLKEGVLYVPSYYEHHEDFRSEELASYFETGKAVHVEFCSGNGDWVVDKAEAHPECIWVAVEKEFPRVRKIFSRREAKKLSNLLIVSGYAEPFLEHYIPENLLEAVYINFPDPWPKDRHAKHRIVKPPFIKLLAGKMKEGGTLHLVTDDQTYANQMREVLMEQKGWKKCERDEVLHEEEGYGNSFFETLFRSQGKQITHLEYTRVTEESCL